MAEQTVELAPGESKEVSFEATPHEAKTYQVSVDGLTGTFRAMEVPVEIVTETLIPDGIISAGCFVNGCRTPGDNLAAVLYNDTDWDNTSPKTGNWTMRCNSSGSDLFSLSAPKLTGEILSVAIYGLLSPTGWASSCDHRLDIVTHGIKFSARGTGVGMSPEPYPWPIFCETYNSNPFTGLPWTEDELIDLKAGYWIKAGLFSGYAVDQLYVHVERVT